MTLDRFSLEKIYMSFIRPILDYADVIWDSQNQSLINKLENVQVDAARIVTWGAKLTGLNRLYEETKDLIDYMKKLSGKNYQIEDKTIN